MVGLELEAFLFEPIDDRGWTPYTPRACKVYRTGTSVDPKGTIEEITQTPLTQ